MKDDLSTLRGESVNIMMLKVNNTDDFQITMELNVDYDTPEIIIKVSFWDKKAHSIQDFEYNARDFNKAIEKFNELEMNTKNKKESPKTMKFVDFINEHLIKNQEEYDAVIGGVDMPATLGMCENWVITDYCKKKFGKLLDSRCKIINDTTVEVIDDVDYRIGRNFCYSVAGYINCEEFDKLFGTHDAEN